MQTHTHEYAQTQLEVVPRGMGRKKKLPRYIWLCAITVNVNADMISNY